MEEQIKTEKAKENKVFWKTIAPYAALLLLLIIGVCVFTYMHIGKRNEINGKNDTILGKSRTVYRTSLSQDQGFYADEEGYFIVGINENPYVWFYGGHYNTEKNSDAWNGSFPYDTTGSYAVSDGWMYYWNDEMLDEDWRGHHAELQRIRYTTEGVTEKALEEYECVWAAADAPVSTIRAMQTVYIWNENLVFQYWDSDVNDFIVAMCPLNGDFGKDCINLSDLFVDVEFDDIEMLTYEGMDIFARKIGDEVQVIDVREHESQTSMIKSEWYIMPEQSAGRFVNLGYEECLYYWTIDGTKIPVDCLSELAEQTDQYWVELEIAVDDVVIEEDRLVFRTMYWDYGVRRELLVSFNPKTGENNIMFDSMGKKDVCILAYENDAVYFMEKGNIYKQVGADGKKEEIWSLPFKATKFICSRDEDELLMIYICENGERESLLYSLK